MERLIAFAAAVVIAYFTFVKLTALQADGYRVDRALDKLGRAASGFCACRSGDAGCLENNLKKIQAMRSTFRHMDDEKIKPTAAQKRRAKKIMDYVRRCHVGRRA